MLLQSLVVSSFAVLSAAATLNTADFQPFEELQRIPSGWTELKTPSGDASINFKLVLNAEDDTALESLLKERADPTSPKYGQWLSQDELNSKFKPSVVGQQAVKRWLNEVGITKINQHRDRIDFSATVEQANKMMNTNFLVYRHINDEKSDAIRTKKVQLPHYVKRHVSMIHPTTRFEQIKEQAVISQLMQGRACSGPGINTPKNLKELYNINNAPLPSGDPAKIGFIGIAGFLEQHARYSDLATFVKNFTDFGNAPVPANFTWTSVKGGKLDQGRREKSSEANLDIQYTVGLTYPMKNEYYSVGGRGPWVSDLDQPTAADNDNEPYFEFMDFLIANKSRPHTVSFSYGEGEHSVPLSYAKTVCQQIGKLGLLGTSIVFASGDHGPGSHCQLNDGTQKTRFNPIFPAACPWVTSVGGTTGRPERAAGLSSGGFSDIWPRPWYQKEQVAKFLEGPTAAKWAEYYNKDGRGFPDIAGQGIGYAVIVNGACQPISGTSASAPVIASVIALLNAQRLTAGQPTLGFVNPWIYQKGATMLNDVAAGASKGCNGGKNGDGNIVQGAEWAAIPGWDPSTGMGTPNYGKMIEQLPKAPAGAPSTAPAAAAPARL